MASETVSFLAVTQPLDLEKSIESGQVFLWRNHDGWYCGSLAGRIVHLRQVEGGLEVGFPRDMRDTLIRVESFFRLDDPFRNIFRQLSKDPLLRSALNRNRGLRLLRQDPWECLLSFICSIDSNIPRIRRNLNTLAMNYGDEISLGNCQHHRLPTPEVLARVGEAKLRELGLGFRARYVDPTAKAFAEGKLSMESLRRLSTSEARQALMSLKGVGEKVADCALVFSLDKIDAFPLDRWVRRAVQEWYFKGEPLSDKAIQIWAKEQFHGYAGYAQQYLFYRRRIDAGRSKF